MNFSDGKTWLVKFAPFRTSWPEVVARGIFTLRAVRSPEARKHLRRMRSGDPVYLYQSQREQAIVGLMQVTREAYPDPTSADPQWLTCDFVPVRTLVCPISLKMIREEPGLQNLGLIRQPRLAVMPVDPEEAHTLRELSDPEYKADTNENW